MIDIPKILPAMLTGRELTDALSQYPDYDESVRNKSRAERLLALSDIYNIYIANKMSTEIYTKFYLSIFHSLQKKQTKLSVRQQYENHKIINRQLFSGIIGGTDSFTITGKSGIGKSSSIDRAVSLIYQNGIIETSSPYSLIAPCVMVQCPADCSLKSLLIEIICKTDEILNSDYYRSLPSRVTTDTLIGVVSQISMNHIGLLIIDEIQNILHHKNGRVLIGALTQLINCSGVSICMVGVPESIMFFEKEHYLARRSLGLQYDAMEYDECFVRTCETFFYRQYTARPTNMSLSILEWLYEHSGGIIANIVNLIHDSQEIAILTGKESLTIETLNEAYQRRMGLLHGYISIEHPSIKSSGKKSTDSISKKTLVTNVKGEYTSVSELIGRAKQENRDVIELLKNNFQVLEVKL